METSDNIKSRRTVRKYLDRPIPKVIIDKLIEAAKHAPSSDDSQSWEFIVISNKKIKRELSELHPWSSHIKNAPISIAILGNTELCKDDFHNTINSSLAMQNLLLEANNQGLGSSIVYVIDNEFENEEKARRILKVPENVLVYCIVTLGYPEGQPDTEYINPSNIHYDYYT